MDETAQNNKETDQDLIKITADLVGAYVQNNVLVANEMPEFIKNVSEALRNIGDEDTSAVAAVEDKTPQKPATSIKKSIQDDHLVCLECGLKFKSLKRHLKTAHNLTPEEYKAKWNLPPDYPIVAPEYSKRRTNIAHKIGLGNKR